MWAVVRKQESAISTLPSPLQACNATSVFVCARLWDQQPRPRWLRHVSHLQDTASSVYRDIGHYDTCKGIWQQLLTSYNQQRKSANLVFFVDALDHLTRLHRVLSLPQVCTQIDLFLGLATKLSSALQS